MKKYFYSLSDVLIVIMIACGGSTGQIMPSGSPLSRSIVGVYEGATNTPQEVGIETSFLIEEDNSFSLVTESGLQMTGNLTQVSNQQYNGMAVLSYADDISLPMLSVNLSITANSSGSLSASFSGAATGSFNVTPSIQASATSTTLDLSSLSGNFATSVRSISTRRVTNWTLTSTGTFTGFDAVSTYSGTLTQPRANKNPFVINFTRTPTGADVSLASFRGLLWFHPAQGTRPARFALASRHITTGQRGIAGVFAKQ